jgi:hypothetical protein
MGELPGKLLIVNRRKKRAAAKRRKITLNLPGACIPFLNAGAQVLAESARGY